MKLILSLVLIFAILSIVKSAKITFDSSKDCITQTCDFSTASNWVGGVAPKAGDEVVISLGSKSVIIMNSFVAFSSVTVTSSILKLNSISSAGTFSNVVLEKNAQFIVNAASQSTLSSITGSGLLIVDPSQEQTGLTIKGAQVDGVYLNGYVSATIQDSTAGFVSQYNASEFVQGPPKQVSFTGTNKVGVLYILGNGLSFANSFTIDGSILPSTYSDLTSYIGSSESSSEDTIAIKATTLTITNAKDIGNAATLVFQGTTLSISSSSFTGGFTSEAQDVSFDGFVKFGTDSSFANNIVFQTTFIQINIQGKFTFNSANVNLKKVGSNSPFIIAIGGMKIDGSITLNFENEPNESQEFIIFKSIGVMEGEFDSVSMNIQDDSVSSKEFSTTIKNNIFILTYSDQIGSASNLSASLVLILSISFLLTLF
ncbi:hypothetical protein DICPUDRAFT_98753 [Dictyostelium purpureum]|uniref:Auto-transporter adhesin head GIN domain-containing protein n=1 Tax=Dictyostelium purpureum TaxID=5786 RepID=F0ZT88_DICPU|nr:uncharacterized protein DICPUDRAFT_98753 [Dictyostelium purpureum]EGC32850.1 hypothetical protein DICPUDRAFT_98753 [Dictyostelium purpureum]|eukprot:XP_003290635.1 hypothetical protein DICPUDRAFT_98753 [Dictyostelium purpureum]